MGQMNSQLFLDIADDAADRLQKLQTASSYNDTSRFPGDMARINEMGSVKLFELLMRRAARACAINQIGETSNPIQGQFISISLTLTLSSQSLKHTDDDFVISRLPVKSAWVDASILDRDDDGDLDPKTAVVLKLIQKEPLAGCKPKPSHEPTSKRAPVRKQSSKSNRKGRARR
jgi:hypothetical protein